MVNNHHASIKLAVTAVVVVALLAFLVKGFQERRKAIELKRQGAVSRANALTDDEADDMRIGNATPPPSLRTYTCPCSHHVKVAQRYLPTLSC